MPITRPWDHDPHGIVPTCSGCDDIGCDRCRPTEPVTLADHERIEEEIMNAEIKAKWIAALRSGKYPQTTRVLHDGKGYCCLGVLAEVIGCWWEGDASRSDDRAIGRRAILDDRHIAGGDEDELLPSEIVGAGASIQTRLAEMNDAGASFATIADYIEKNL